MEKSVIYRDRQELQAADLNNTQTWADEALRHVVMDAITSERQFVGLTVTAYSATEIQVSIGRVIEGSTGKVYAIETAETHSLFSLMPLQNEKWLAVSAIGQEEQVNLEPRDFLIDLSTREVEPQTVAMQSRRVALIHIASGLESTTPEKPDAPTGYCLLAHVRLSPSGIQEVVLATSRYLPNLNAVEARVTAAEGWITSATPRISTLMTDVAGLASDLMTRATMAQAIQLGIDMARVKERLEIPDNYVFYGADHFLDDEESNPAAAGYAALIEEGVRFPVAASGSSALALFNPLDSAVTVSDDGFVLPAYDEVMRLNLATRTGELTINQYQYNTLGLVQKTITRTRIRYGKTRTVCTNGQWWQSGQYDPASGIFRLSGETWQVAADDLAAAIVNHQWIRVTQFWVDEWQEPYWDVVTETHTVQGSQLSQTFLSAQTGWLTSVEVYLTGVAADGVLNVLLCQVRLGQPDLEQVLAVVSINAGNLTTGWNRIPWSRPIYVTAGERYAVVLVTGSAHRVGTTAGTEYTQGQLLYAQDGAYFQAAGETDLMLRLNFAKFRSPRASVQLQPLQLAGGIADLDLLFEGFRPAGCDFHFEYQVGGVWTPMSGDDAYGLGSLPALLPLRAVFTGTTDLMPGIRMTDSRAIVQRFAAAFVHISTTRTLGSASNSIRVRCLLEYFNPTVHTFAIKLIVGGSTITATSTLTEIVDDSARWFEARFTLGSTTTSYVIRLEGATSDATVGFHVAERYDLAL